VGRDPVSQHLFTQPDDNGLSECTRGCGVFRLLCNQARTHQPLYSRSRSLRDGTWGARALPCVEDRPDHAR
jgi:hypothetical protein